METTRLEKRFMVICDKRQLETIMQEFEDWNTKQGLEIHCCSLWHDAEKR